MSAQPSTPGTSPATKTARQARITAILTGQSVRSQAELAALLADDGVQVTQALFEAGTDATPWRSRGIPVYGIYPYPISHGYLKAIHGNDERVPIRGLEQGTDMLTRVLRETVG